ncbi:MAG: hypothetical protein BGP06_13655 [Rhizobiales bacterium 65-9]|nr:YdcF family protein [Hyphomicrobiales bacterium]OJY36740.1 MAG: hypothetical protein BGP06_13655 [Rhizobiales bacterium 65-9]
MFNFLSKLSWLFFTPSNLLILLTLVGAALCWTRFARSGRSLALAASGLLLAAGLTPLSAFVIAPLEDRFPDWRSGPRHPPQGIIILSGGVNTEISEKRIYPLELNDAGDRILALVELARAYPEAKLVFTGAIGSFLGGTGGEADEVRAKIGAFGPDPGKILFERRSGTTYENAVYTRDLVRPEPDQRWLLVTSASHMPRAIACFRAAGFDVEAYPVDYRSAPGGWSSSREASLGLRRLDVAMREWIGLVAYRISGRTKELFPGP